MLKRLQILRSSKRRALREGTLVLMDQGLLSIANGGLTGSGIGGSNSKLGYLPLAHSDFIFAVIAAFGAIAYVKWTESKIDRIDSAELTSLATVAPGSSEPLNFLVIATDDRSNLPDDWNEDAFGEFTGRRTDVMMLAHMVPGERIQLLSLPRDLMVDIEGHGTNRLNASYVVGGPDLLIKTVQQETGIPVGFGVITADHAGQAKARAEPIEGGVSTKKGNQGAEAADAVHVDHRNQRRGRGRGGWTVATGCRHRSSSSTSSPCRGCG